MGRCASVNATAHRCTRTRPGARGTCGYNSDKRPRGCVRAHHDHHGQPQLATHHSQSLPAPSTELSKLQHMHGLHVRTSTRTRPLLVSPLVTECKLNTRTHIARSVMPTPAGQRPGLCIVPRSTTCARTNVPGTAVGTNVGTNFGTYGRWRGGSCERCTACTPRTESACHVFFPLPGAH